MCSREQAISWLSVDEHFEKIVQKSMAKLNRVDQGQAGEDDEGDDDGPLPKKSKCQNGSYSGEGEKEPPFKSRWSRVIGEARNSFRAMLPSSVEVFDPQ